jgi:putative ABC transport system substrate-binding protein
VGDFSTPPTPAGSPLRPAARFLDAGRPGQNDLERAESFGGYYFACSRRALINVRIDTRHTEADAHRFRTYAAELVALAPDVILAATTAGVTEVQQATRTVPIVFVTVMIPSARVSSRIWRNLAETQLDLPCLNMAPTKWLELLKEIAPGVTRVAVVREPASVSGTGQLAAIQAVAPSFGVE